MNCSTRQNTTKRGNICEDVGLISRFIVLELFGSCLFGGSCTYMSLFLKFGFHPRRSQDPVVKQPQLVDTILGVP